MNDLTQLAHGAAAAILVLLLIFEVAEGRTGRAMPCNKGYEYYTPDGSRVRLCHTCGTLYKVYVFDDNCPVPVRQDRVGSYFTVRAHSAQAAEYAVDDLYQRGGSDLT